MNIYAKRQNALWKSIEIALFYSAALCDDIDVEYYVRRWP